MAPTIVHFEIPSDNIERAKKFYNNLFGWNMEKVPGPMEYWMFATGTNTNSKSEQTISGGVMERKMSNEPITIYIGVESVNDYAKKVEELGGKVIKPRTEVAGYGWFAVCMDTENNLFALWETSATNTK
jgi:predicted enzyme related to lactoylglutathione lyase